MQAKHQSTQEGGDEDETSLIIDCQGIDEALEYCKQNRDKEVLLKINLKHKGEENVESVYLHNKVVGHVFELNQMLSLQTEKVLEYELVSEMVRQKIQRIYICRDSDDYYEPSPNQKLMYLHKLRSNLSDPNFKFESDSDKLKKSALPTPDEASTFAKNVKTVSKTDAQCVFEFKESRVIKDMSGKDKEIIKKVEKFQMKMLQRIVFKHDFKDGQIQLLVIDEDNQLILDVSEIKPIQNEQIESPFMWLHILWALNDLNKRLNMVLTSDFSNCHFNSDFLTCFIDDDSLEILDQSNRQVLLSSQYNMIKEAMKLDDNDAAKHIVAILDEANSLDNALELISSDSLLCLDYLQFLKKHSFIVRDPQVLLERFQKCLNSEFLKPFGMQCTNTINLNNPTYKEIQQIYLELIAPVWLVGCSNKSEKQECQSFLRKHGFDLFWQELYEIVVEAYVTQVVLYNKRFQSKTYINDLNHELKDKMAKSMEIIKHKNNKVEQLQAITDAISRSFPKLFELIHSKYGLSVDQFNIDTLLMYTIMPYITQYLDSSFLQKLRGYLVKHYY